MEAKNRLSRPQMLRYLALGTAFVFLLWVGVAFFVASPVVPYPHDVFIRLWQLLLLPQTYLHVGASLLRLVIALTVSFIVGIVLGIFAGLYPRFQAFMRPLMLVMRTLPTASLILIIVSLTRIRSAPIIVVSMIALPLAYEAMVTGLHNIDQNVYAALRLEGEKNWLAISKVLLPSTAPYLTLGLLQMIGLGMKVEVMSEVLAGSTGTAGLGFAIHTAYAINVAYLDLYAYSVLAIIVIAGAEIILALVKKHRQQK